MIKWVIEKAGSVPSYLCANKAAFTFDFTEDPDRALKFETEAECKSFCVTAGVALSIRLYAKQYVFSQEGEFLGYRG